METHTANTGTWSAPECPISIEYSLRVLDDIRLAVTEAFFSLPRGGAEIGGVLLGSCAGGKLRITGHLPLDCEHATGPSFTLSARDEAELEKLLQSPECRQRGARAVGWYHSHTRSEIFLSDADLAIHSRYFPEAWQVALVLKPHTFEPTRAAFFFRERSGQVQSAASAGEFALEPLPIRTAESSEPDEVREPAPAAEAAPRMAATRETEAQVPQFLITREERSWRWLKRLLALAVGLALGCILFATRELWLFRAIDGIRPSAAYGPGPLGLSTVETDGQMQIRWNPHAPKVQRGTGAVLTILDGDKIPRGVLLDADHLLSGVFSYAPQHERVDVTLALKEPDGQEVRESTTFLGPGVPVSADTERVKKLEADLAAETERNQALEKDLSEAKAWIKSLRKKRAGAKGPARETAGKQQP